jgi:hypothetical protein
LLGDFVGDIFAEDFWHMGSKGDCSWRFGEIPHVELGW